MTSPERPDAFPATDDEWTLAARYVAGELSDVEAATVRARLRAAGDEGEFLEKLRTIRPAAAPHRVDVEAALRTVRSRMDAGDAPDIGRIPARRPVPASPALWRVAAAVVLIAGIGYVATRSAPKPAPPVAAAPTVHQTAPGMRDSVVLSDDSRVLLGPGSRLSVPASFDSARTVELDGIAAFEVVHDATRPFTVRTATAEITDIGTRFTVHDVPGGATEVAVQSGAVSVRPARPTPGTAAQGVTLDRGDAGRVAPNGQVMAARGGASADDRAWESGRLVFRDAPMVRVRSELRRWYGVELVSTDSVIATRHLTAAFQRESRREVLDVIALALGAAYEQRADSIILRPLASRPPNP
jgi:transmembrane sensor